MGTTLQRPGVPEAPRLPEGDEKRVVLDNISWTTYEALLADHQDRSVPRFTFDQGVLEIVRPSLKHEGSSWALQRIVEVYAEAAGISFLNAGSTTFKRKDWERGFEADSTFYIQSAECMRGKAEVDPTVDPPPDLVIEIDVTRTSLNKLAIYAQFGVREAWRCEGTDVTIYALDHGRYVERTASLVLPGLSVADLSRLLEEYKRSSQSAWLRSLRQWAAQEGTGQA